VSSLGRSIVVYACAFGVAGATPFVLLPLLTRHLSPAEFGQATAFLMFTALLANVTGLSAHGFASVRFFKASAAELPHITGSAVAMLAASHLVALALVALVHPWLRALFDLPLKGMLLGVAAAWVLNLNLLGLALFQAAGEAMRYLQARLVQAALEIALGTAVLVLVAAEAWARTGTYTLALAASATFGLAMAWRSRRLAPVAEGRWARELLTFGLPLVPHILAGTLVVYVDRLTVASLLGAQGLGLYMAALQIGMAMTALVEPLNKALAPWLFKQLARDDPEVRSMLVRRTYQLFAGLVAAGLLLWWLADIFFERLVGAAYAGARPLLPWLVAGFVAQGLYAAVVNYLFYAEKTGRLSVVSVWVAVLGGGLSYAMTRQWGLQGAALSFAVNSSALFLLVWATAARAVPMPWLGRRVRV
jgi:O-antigen/teichoic acid export membrane protein